MNYSETDRGEEKNPRQEIWILYHEDNAQYAVEGVDIITGGTTRRSGSDNMIDYISDPYSTSFVSFRNRGPVEERYISDLVTWRTEDSLTLWQ